MGFKDTILSNLLKILIELIGTTLFTLIFFCGLSDGLASIGELTGLWVLLIIGSRISGGHYNPAITLSFMLRKNTGKFSRLLGLAYILF